MSPNKQHRKFFFLAEKLKWSSHWTSHQNTLQWNKLVFIKSFTEIPFWKKKFTWSLFKYKYCCPTYQILLKTQNIAKNIEVLLDLKNIDKHWNVTQWDPWISPNIWYSLKFLNKVKNRFYLSIYEPPHKLMDQVKQVDLEIIQYLWISFYALYKKTFKLCFTK